MAVMTVSEARAALPEVLNRVAAGEEVTITRHGQPIAVVVRPDVMWSRSRAEVALSGAAHLHNLLSTAAGTALEGAAPPPGGGSAGGSITTTGGSMTAEYAEQLIAEIRADRDAR
jgi:antitoxin (DNA-binding transcriptional repressor) of toxin-antitoxin stability system